MISSKELKFTNIDCFEIRLNAEPEKIFFFSQQLINRTLFNIFSGFLQKKEIKVG